MDVHVGKSPGPLHCECAYCRPNFCLLSMRPQAGPADGAACMMRVTATAVGKCAGPATTTAVGLGDVYGV